MLSVFNSYVKKLPNLESSFLIIDATWNNKTVILSIKTFTMVINLSKVFFKLNYFLLFEIKNKSRERKLLNFKSWNKSLTRIQKLHQIIYSCCNPQSSVFTEPFNTNLLSPRRTLESPCICRAKDIIHTTYLHYPSPCNYVTSLLAYCRG